jgi:hypothetical protein
MARLFRANIVFFGGAESCVADPASSFAPVRGANARKPLVAKRA